MKPQTWSEGFVDAGIPWNGISDGNLTIKMWFLKQKQEQQTQ